MRIKQILPRWLLIIGLAAAISFYLRHFSPYQSDGSLNSVVILVAFGMLAALSFFFLQAILGLFFKHRLTTQLAFLGSFALVQTMLINSWNFIDWSSLLVILLFNFFICWYALKVL